jgi:hypothetical protein
MAQQFARALYQSAMTFHTVQRRVLSVINGQGVCSNLEPPGEPARRPEGKKFKKFRERRHVSPNTWRQAPEAEGSESIDLRSISNVRDLTSRLLVCWRHVQEQLVCIYRVLT